MSPSISLNSPWYFYVLSPAFALLVALWLYYRNSRNKDAPLNVLRFLFALRFLGFTLITFFLLNIFLKRVLNQTENPVILLAVDNSSSMVSGSDSVYFRGEFEEQLENFKKGIGEKYEVKQILFGENSRQSNDLLRFTEKETDLDNLVKDIENNYSGQNVGALIIASDGIYNRGANPLYSAEKLGFLIYALAAGDTTENKDALVQKVNHNQVAYLGNNFPVEVVLNAKKLKDKDLVVGLYQDGTLRSEQTIKAGSDNFSGTCNFTLNAASVGVVKYSVVLREVKGEKNLANNNQSFFIEVIDNRDKVLLLANAPHPDLSAINGALAGFDNYEVENGLFESFNRPLKAYSLVIFHGFGNAQLSLLNECRNNSTPVWIVNPNGTENLPGVKISSTINRYNDSEPFLNESFGLFGISDALRKFVKELPAVKTYFGNYVTSNGASSFLGQKIGSVETDNPIQLFSEMNGFKCGLFLGDGLWRWKLRDYAEHKNNDLFNELIGKTVQYLAVKSDKSFFRINPPRIVNENENVEFSGEVYNKSYEAVTDPDVSLVLINSENKKFNYTFSKASNSYRLNVGHLAPGDYNYTASVNNNGQLLTKKGSITVREVLSEKINTVADHRLLYQLSSRSNGKLFYPKQLDALRNELLANENIKPITYSENSVSPLIELKWLFFVALFLLATEWLLRKRHIHI